MVDYLGQIETILTKRTYIMLTSASFFFLNLETDLTPARTHKRELINWRQIKGNLQPSFN